MKPAESDPMISPLFKKNRRELTYKLPNTVKTSILDTLFGRSSERALFLNWMSFGAGAAACCLALTMAFQFGKMSSLGANGQTLTEEVVSTHVRSMMLSQHLSDVISTDQHTVKPWFDGKIDFAPNVKDFAAQGFPLIGGRLDYLDGRPTAALVYKSNLHVINLLQHPSSDPGSPEPTFKTIRGYQIFYWSKEGMRYWAVSDLNAVEMQRFVQLWH